MTVYVLNCGSTLAVRMCALFVPVHRYRVCAPYVGVHRYRVCALFVHVHRYRVALRDRLEDAYDMQVAPMPPEGTAVTYTSEKGGHPQPATVILVNNGMGW